jgi:hypothetical protein
MTAPEPRDQIVDRARRGNGGVTPAAPQNWSSIERQTLIELVGLGAEIRDGINRIADALENQKEKPAAREIPRWCATRETVGCGNRIFRAGEVVESLERPGVDFVLIRE